jgi:hypothetical protein
MNVPLKYHRLDAPDRDHDEPQRTINGPRRQYEQKHRNQSTPTLTLSQHAFWFHVTFTADMDLLHH